MMRQLIIGIDPGTTTAYAILDLDCRIIAVKSSKELNLDCVIREVTLHGTALIVGTDKKKCPQMVRKFAAKTGAAKAIPDQDVTEAEKNVLARNRKAENTHQKDAIASALLAYKQYEPLIRRVYKYLGKERKLELAEEVMNIVVQRKISIDKALKRVELPLVSAY